MAAKLQVDYAYTFRNIDDLVALGNPSFGFLHYTTDLFEGFRGVYPECFRLSVTSQRNASFAVIMNLFICHDVSLFQLTTTRLHDKFRFGPVEGS